jgi:hypothetical protein
MRWCSTDQLSSVWFMCLQNMKCDSIHWCLMHVFCDIHNPHTAPGPDTYTSNHYCCYGVDHGVVTENVIKPQSNHACRPPMRSCNPKVLVLSSDPINFSLCVAMLIDQHVVLTFIQHINPPPCCHAHPASANRSTQHLHACMWWCQRIGISCGVYLVAE